MDRNDEALRAMSRYLQRYKEPWLIYRRNKLAVIGLMVMLFFISIAFLAPFIAPYDPFALSDKKFVSPCAGFPMGTDDLGRDIFSGVLYGARASLLVGFSAAAFSALIGILIGMVSGYFGGGIDSLLMGLTETILVIPAFILALVIVSLFGASILNVILVITIFSWPSTARLVRAEVLSLKERGFIEASRVIGEKESTIVFMEILPNALPSVTVNASLQAASAILLEAGLSFLGLGDPDIISWGRILRNASMFLRQAWWISFFPGLAIFASVLSLNLIVDGLNDALNPRLRGGGE